MIVYKYLIDNKFENEIHMKDDGPGIIKVDSDVETGYYFLDELEIYINRITKSTDLNLKSKKILDVGMGNGNILKYISKKIENNVYGVDLSNQIYYNNYNNGFTFPNTDVRNLPKEFQGTFDLVYQRLFSVPFKDTLSVLNSISKLLKKDGIYVVTFGDDEYRHDESFVVKILKELYNIVDIRKMEYRDRIIGCSAMYPKENPVLTPMSSYYYTLNDEEYHSYKNASSEKQRQKILDLSKK